MKKRLLLFVLATVLFSACKKEDLQPAGTQQLKNTMRSARPFSGSMLYHISSVDFLTCNCGAFASAGTYTGSGTLSHLGLTTSNIKACFAPIFSGSNVVGLYTGHECASFVAANGDEVYLDTHPYNLMFGPAGASGSTTIDIVGGTGRFSAATGSFTADVSIDGTQTIGTLTNISGTINY